LDAVHHHDGGWTVPRSVASPRTQHRCSRFGVSGIIDIAALFPARKVHCTKRVRAVHLTGDHLGLELGANEEEIMATVRALDSDACDKPARACVQPTRAAYSHLAATMY
jgi:hypothetical protein